MTSTWVKQVTVDLHIIDLHDITGNFALTSKCLGKLSQRIGHFCPVLDAKACLADL